MEHESTYKADEVNIMLAAYHGRTTAIQSPIEQNAIHLEIDNWSVGATAFFLAVERKDANMAQFFL